MELPGIGGCKNNALNTPLMFDPGERWEYGINIDWAGKMVEAVSGKKLGEYFQENLFAPLGMDSTAFKITPTCAARLASPPAQRRRRAGADRIEMPQEPEFEMGGGGIYSTAGDYLKFVRMMLNSGMSGNGNRAQAGDGGADVEERHGQHQGHAAEDGGSAADQRRRVLPRHAKNWGLLHDQRAKAPTGRTPGSLAWAGLANTYYWIDQKKGVAGVYMTQVLPFADAKALPLFYAFEKSVYGHQKLAPG